jgi:uracil-DNA glycosylase family 4
VNVRDEQVLRELNLYPLWVRRGVPAQEEVVPAPVAIEVPEVAQEMKAEAPVAKVPPVVDIPNVASIPEVASLDWAALKEKVRACDACELRAGCTQTVFGVGDENADWLFVGEGPGAEEDAQGEPFVGQAGKLLDNMLMSIGLKRGDNVYIANIVKCQPPENHNPDAKEIAACMPYLQQQVALIKPKLIVALGKVAATSLLGRDANLGSLRGTTYDFHGIPLLITYHPAYLLRSPAEKAKAWQDLRSAVALMK